MKNIDKLKEEYEVMGRAIRMLEELERESDHGKLAEVMPEGVLCHATNRPELLLSKYRKFRSADYTESLPYAADWSRYSYIHFPTRPMLPWLGESSSPPVHPDTKVKVWYRSEETDTDEAKSYMWKWLNSSTDIVAYRVEEWA